MDLQHLPMRNWRRAFYEMRTEGAGREAASVGTGVFIGCLPIYGFHLLLVMIVGRILRLNRLQMYVAANVSNPLMAPLLILAQVQAGAWVRRAELHSLTLDAIRNTSPWTFGGDLVVGSVIVGATLGLLTALVTRTATAGARHATPRFIHLSNRVADRYLATSITAWEFARAKLLSDPVYEEVSLGGVLASGRALLDVGCGQGLMLGVLAEIRRESIDGHESAGPVFERLVGVELRPRIAAMARAVLGPDAEIIASDVRALPVGSVDSVLAFDVLHMIDAADQEPVVASLANALEPGGVMIVREVDAGGGWRFRLVQLGNRLKAIATGNWRQRFAFRTSTEWTALFARAGLEVTAVPMSKRTPFANMLFVTRKKGLGNSLIPAFPARARSRRR